MEAKNFMQTQDIQSMLIGNKITIDIAWYTELVDVYSRVCAVERMIQQGGYISTDDVQAVLGIVKENENETV